MCCTVLMTGALWHIKTLPENVKEASYSIASSIITTVVVTS